MKNAIIRFFKFFGLSIGSFNETAFEKRSAYFRYKEIFERFRSYTMIPHYVYLDNLELASSIENVAGDIVECGVWRGGMIAGISQVLGKNRNYWLLDSFEGLPPAKEIDGKAAQRWQANTRGEHYHDNCAAEERFAREAMSQAGTQNYQLVRGWFNETTPRVKAEKIALLRLDGDWYESTMTCLEAFYDRVTEGGIIIIDDYYYWDGCTKAVHDFLSKHGHSDRICQSAQGVAYIVKNKMFNPLQANL